MTQRKPGRKINFFSGRHLALKYFKVVVNSKKLVAIMIHTRKNNFYPVAVLDRLEDTRIGHIQHKRSTKPKMVSSDDRFTFEIVHVLRFGNWLNEELRCKFVFTNLPQSLDI